MKLSRQGDNLSGSYSYKRIGIDIPIKGTISGRHVLIKEYGGKDGSQTGQFEGDFASDAEISGNWSNASGDRVMVFSLKEKQTTVAGAAPSQSASSPPSTPDVASPATPPQPAQPSTKIELGQLTTDKVQRAVDKALDWTRKGGGATVSGIQEFPQESAARADVRFDGFQYNANVEGSPVSKDKTTPPEPSINDPRFYEKMAQHGLGAVQVKRFSGRGTAILKHYNDGRWVLTSVQFDWVGVNANVEVR